MSEKTTMNVIVHKANIPMMKGESVQDFTSKLSDSGREHIMKKLNITGDAGGAYMVEAFQDAVVFSTYKYKTRDPSKYYAFKYTRKDGNFEFGSTVEVERIVSFKPKSPAVMKKKKEDESDEMEKGCGDKVKKGFVQYGDWIQTEKSFWMGVL